MEFRLIPSLLDTALITTVITLWNQDDIKNLMIESCFPLNAYQRYTALRQVEDKVKEEVEQLPLPKRIKEQIIDFIKPIGLEICRWEEFHSKKGIDTSIYGSYELHWTAQGTVNKKKTAEMITKYENYGITSRYKLACLYCFESDIVQLWNKMPENCKKMFYSEEPRVVSHFDLVYFWTSYINGGLTRIRVIIQKTIDPRLSPYQYAFEGASSDYNKLAAEYFLKKLNAKERNKSLVKCAKDIVDRNFFTNIFNDIYSGEVLCFLLSQMDEELQMKVFENCSYTVLLCFLDWPWQEIFMQNFKKGQDLLGKCDSIADYMLEKSTGSYRDYKTLFWKLWNQIPPSAKRSLMDKDCVVVYLFYKLFETRNEKNIRLLLKFARITAKKAIIFGSCGKWICADLMRGRKWDLFKFIIRQCTSQVREVRVLKDSLKADTPFPLTNDERDEYYRVFDDIIHEYNRRRR